MSIPSTTTPAPPQEDRVHPRAFEPLTLVVMLLSSILGAIIGIQIITTLGVTPNTAIIGVLVAIAISRIPVPALRKMRSVHRQNLVQSNISTATFTAANSLLLPIGIPVYMGQRQLVWPMLIGAAAAMVIDFLMLYWLYDSKVFPGNAAWPPGLAAAEAIKAGDTGGRRALLLGAGTVVGIGGSAIGIPMSAFGVAFIGNIVALTMFGVGLLLRGFSPQLFGVDIAKLYIPHGLMIGAGLVALIQAVLSIVRSHQPVASDADRPTTGVSIEDLEAETRAGVFVQKALVRGFVLYVIASIVLAVLGGLYTQMSLPRLVLWVVFAAVSCILAEFIVGLSAMHSGWFPAFATALIFLILGILMGFPPLALALLVGFVAAGGPAFADAGYDFKAGWILRRTESRVMELEGRRQQLLAGLVGMAVSLVVVALVHNIYFNAGQFPPIVKVFAATIKAGVDPELVKTLFLWAIPGAVLQLVGGSKRQMGILLATGTLILNPLAGWSVLAGIVLRLIYPRVRKDKEAADTEMTIAAAGFIAGDALWSFGSSAVKAVK